MKNEKTILSNNRTKKKQQRIKKQRINEGKKMEKK